MKQQIVTFLESPSSRTGMVALFALALSVLTQYLGHDLSASGAMWALIFGVGKIVQPDNTAAIAQKAATDTITK
jgi:hypothetical protein